MDRMIRWGIIGLGKIARKFAQDLLLTDDSRLYAIASRREEGLQAFHELYPAEKRYHDYEHLLEDPEVDIVYIATPHSHHYPWILRCLDKGKHVLCEKPLCVNADQVHEVIRRQRETGLFVMEALWTRFLPAYIHLKNELEKEDQPIQSLTADFCYPSVRGEVARIYEPMLAGGSLLDIGIYPLFLALDLMGIPDNYQVAGWVDRGVDIRFTAVLAYDKGRTAMIHSDVQSVSRMDAVIRMSNSAIVLPHRWHEMDGFVTMDQNTTLRHDFPKTGWGYFHEIEHVNHCLKNGLDESPVYPLYRTLVMSAYMDEFRTVLDLNYPEEIEKI